MAKQENRAQSINRLRNQAIRDVKAALKKRNIAIPEIEGASEDDADLRNLQEWQAIARAFEEDDAKTENSASAGNLMSGDASPLSADTMDSGATSKTSKTPKGL